jgi:hypothetical protein
MDLPLKIIPDYGKTGKEKEGGEGQTMKEKGEIT